MESKRVLIIHHNDRDGYMSAAVLYHYLKNKDCYNDIYTRKIDYSTGLWEVYKKCISSYGDIDEIYIVDYSVSNIVNAQAMLKINKECKKLVWIDHHVSSIKRMEEYPELRTIEGFRLIGMAGVGLTYLYTMRDSLKYEYEKELLDIIYQFSNTYTELLKSDALKILTSLDCPEICVLTHRYDIFDIDEDVLKFNYGCPVESVSDAFGYLYLKSKTDENLLKNIIHDGEVIKGYLDKWNKVLVEENAQEVVLTMGDYGDPYNSSEEKKFGLALNHTTFNSLVFGDTIKKYDFVMIYAKEKDLWRHSLYTVSDDFDCSKVAEFFGGGGHKKAACFCLDAPFFVSTNMIKIIKKSIKKENKDENL